MSEQYAVLPLQGKLTYCSVSLLLTLADDGVADVIHFYVLFVLRSAQSTKLPFSRPATGIIKTAQAVVPPTSC